MPPLTDIWRLTGTGTFTETVPVLTDGGAMVPTELQRECQVDIALRWGTGYDTVVRSRSSTSSRRRRAARTRPGFDQGLLKFLRQQVEQNARRLKAGNDKLEKDDVLAGLTAVHHGAPARAAVRGPDQGGARHAGRARIVANVLAKELGAAVRVDRSATTRRSRRCCSTRSSPR